LTTNSVILCYYTQFSAITKDKKKAVYVLYLLTLRKKNEVKGNDVLQRFGFRWSH